MSADAMLAMRVCLPVLLLWSQLFLVSASSCKVTPQNYFYSYEESGIDSEHNGCAEYLGRPNAFVGPYMQCTDNTLPLSDGDFGPDYDITNQTERLWIYNIWERLAEQKNYRVLLNFDPSITPAIIRLHYFSDPTNGIGVPSLRFYPNIKNIWNNPSPNEIPTVSSPQQDESEFPHRRVLDFNVNDYSTMLTSLFLHITFNDGSTVTKFYLSEIEVFTCCPATTSPVTTATPVTTTMPVTTTTSVTTTTPLTQTTTPTNPPTMPNETPSPVLNTSNDSSSSSNSSPAAAIAGVLVALLVITAVTVLLSVAALVCYRRKKGRKRHKVIQHVGEDESNTYALVHKPNDTAPAIPEQNFDPVYEGLVKLSTVHSDPSTGQSSTSPLPGKKNGFKDLPEQDEFQEYTEITRPREVEDTSDSQHDSPPLHPSGTTEHSTIATPLTYDTIDDTKHGSPDLYYSTPAVTSNGYPPASTGKGDTGEGTYEDTLSATDRKSSANRFQENVPVAVEKDAFAMPLEMYATVN